MFEEFFILWSVNILSTKKPSQRSLLKLRRYSMADRSPEFLVTPTIWMLWLLIISSCCIRTHAQPWRVSRYGPVPSEMETCARFSEWVLATLGQRVLTDVIGTSEVAETKTKFQGWGPGHNEGLTHSPWSVAKGVSWGNPAEFWWCCSPSLGEKC